MVFESRIFLSSEKVKYSQSERNASNLARRIKMSIQTRSIKPLFGNIFYTTITSTLSRCQQNCHCHIPIHYRYMVFFIRSQVLSFVYCVLHQTQAFICTEDQSHVSPTHVSRRSLL